MKRQGSMCLIRLHTIYQSSVEQVQGPPCREQEIGVGVGESAWSVVAEVPALLRRRRVPLGARVPPDLPGAEAQGRPPDRHQGQLEVINAMVG